MNYTHADMVAFNKKTQFTQHITWLSNHHIFYISFNIYDDKNPTDYKHNIFWQKQQHTHTQAGSRAPTKNTVNTNFAPRKKSCVVEIWFVNDYFVVHVW